MPVYASHLAEYDALSIGQRIHDERKRMGVTMQDLKRRCGISTAKLSRIVNGHDVLDLQQALAIATALGLHVRAFLPEDTNLPFQISRDAELRTRAPRAMALVSADGTPVRKHQSQFWPLADLFVGRHTEPVTRAHLTGHRRKAAAALLPRSRGILLRLERNHRVLRPDAERPATGGAS